VTSPLGQGANLNLHVLVHDDFLAWGATWLAPYIWIEVPNILASMISDMFQIRATRFPRPQSHGMASLE